MDGGTLGAVSITAFALSGFLSQRGYAYRLHSRWSRWLYAASGFLGIAGVVLLLIALSLE